jgi:hypothetical protein
VIGVPGAATASLAVSLRTLPNVFVWWHPLLRERLMPDHGYPRFPTRAIAQALDIATRLRVLARTTAPATRRITIVVNQSETGVNNGAARALAAAWRAHAGTEVELQRVTGLPLSHDILEALRPGTVARRAYRTLLPILHAPSR